MAGGNSQWVARLAAALAFSLASAFFALGLLRARYESRLRRQIWPDNVLAISVISNGPAGSARTVLLLGDSRMAQWGLPALAPWRVVNAGAAGFTTGQILLCAPALLDQIQPDVVVLQAAINDLKFLGLRPEMLPQVMTLALSNITAIVQDSARHHCKVILLPTWPAGKPSLARSLVWSKAVSAAVAQLNAQLQELNCEEKGIRVVDLFKEAGLNPGVEFYGDALHLKPAAYQLLTPLLRRELDAAAKA
jgi:lysophospholipase L1-like esterase